MIARAAAALALLVSSALGCSPAPPPAVQGSASAEVPPPAVASVAPAPIAAPGAPAGATACGALGCLAFPDGRAALRQVLEDKPLALGVGEAHAQKAGAKVASSVKRFADEMLPELQGKASDLVIELMAPPSGCEEKKQEVKKKLEPVTNVQRETNQNEYVALGDAALKLGIQPHLLHPTCDDMKAVSAPGGDPVEKSLLLIARLMRESAEKVLARNAKAGVEKMVVLYGGALHNDLAPAAEGRDLAFGPPLVQLTHDRYVELDVFVPEFIGDSGLWTRFPWRPQYQRESMGGKAVLFTTAPRTHTILWPVSPAAPAAPAP